MITGHEIQTEIVTLSLADLNAAFGPRASQISLSGQVAGEQFRMTRQALQAGFGSGRDRREALCNFAKEGNIGGLRVAVAAGASIYEFGSGRLTPLIYAAINGRKEFMEELRRESERTDNTPLLINGPIEKDLSPLMCSIIAGQKECAKQLVGWKADIHAADKNGTTALAHAAMKGDEESAEMLVRAEPKADIDAQDKNGRPVILYAVAGGNSRVVQLLIGEKAHLNRPDNDGWNAVMQAAATGKSIILRQLIAAGAEIHAVRDGGISALTAAKIKEQHECVEILEAAIKREESSRPPHSLRTTDTSGWARGF